MDWKNLYAPEHYEHYVKVAEGLHRSRAVQRPWLQNPEAIIFVMQMGIDMGISPMLALDKIRKLGDNWMIEINLARSLVARNGGRFEVLEQTDKHIKTKLVRPSEDGIGEHIETITIEELNRAGTTRKNSFKSFPKQIFRAAAFRQSCAVLFPDILHGTVVADFAHEGLEEVPADSENEVSQETVTEEDHKPKVTKKRRTKAQLAAVKDKLAKIMNITSAGGLVGASDFSPDDADEMPEVLKHLRAAKYKWNDRDQCWVSPEVEKQHVEEKVAQQKAEQEEPPPPEEAHPFAPPQDFDLKSNEQEVAENFDAQRPEHISMLTKAAAEMRATWTQEVDSFVRDNYMSFSKGRVYKATLDSIKEVLKECACQFHN